MSDMEKKGGEPTIPDPRFRSPEPVAAQVERPPQRVQVGPPQGQPPAPAKMHPFDEFEYVQNVTVVFKNPKREEFTTTGTTPLQKTLVDVKDSAVILTRLQGKAPAHKVVEQWVFPVNEILSLHILSAKQD